MSIAGSDPSGGAGIQADIKTFAALNVYGSAVITCLTAQNSKRVSSFRAVPGDFIQEQIELVLDDLPISHIKIGMVGSPEAAQAITASLATFTGQIIFDPVLKGSDGSSLLGEGTMAQLLKVVGISTVITPNIPELEVLTQQPCNNKNEIHQQASLLLDRFPKLQAVVVTGGHYIPADNMVSDLLMVKSHPGQKPITKTVKHPRIVTDNSHGTGCAFSSAFTAYHLKQKNYLEAFVNTCQFIDKLLRVSSPYEGGMQHYMVK